MVSPCKMILLLKKVIAKLYCVDCVSARYVTDHKSLAMAKSLLFQQDSFWRFLMKSVCYLPQAFYHTLMYMDRPQGRGLEMARKHIAAALLELQAIRSSASFLSSGQASNLTEKSNERGSTASGRPAIGFDESVNRRLLAPTPPRSIKILSWENVSSVWCCHSFCC